MHGVNFNTFPYTMKTEKEKMLAGELYDALDQELTDERIRTRL